MQDLPDTPTERTQRRRTRRWKRRARVVGPFFGLPLLLLTLSLSVDLIEYQPQPEPDRLADRPIQMPEPSSTNRVWQDRLPESEVAAEIPNATDNLTNLTQEAKRSENSSENLDVILPLPAASRSSTPPYALNRR